MDGKFSCRSALTCVSRSGPGNNYHQRPLPRNCIYLIYVANWPERRNHAWKSLLTARAIENQCYTIGVNRVGMDGHQVYHSGDSTVVDPLGNTLFTRSHDELIHTIQFQKETLNEVREQFPFWKEADQFQILTNHG